ncbi:hypothetical protein EDC96DRAFT_517259 [Choanephora cucurbitarum]|nr:hypothetical protein EDC96DRAFT_517259 [Choanephora cucurbitarum]
MKVGFSLTCRPVRGRVTGEGGPVLSRQLTLWSFSLLTLFVSVLVFFSRRCSLVLSSGLCPSFPVTSKIIQKKVNVYLLSSLFFSYCCCYYLKQLFSTILHQ